MSAAPPATRTPPPATVLADALARLERRIARASWFAAAGEPPGAAEREDLAAWLAGLGLAPAEVAAARDWREAESLLRDPAWDHAWWDAEEALRTRYRDAALGAMGGEALLGHLSRITDAASRVVPGTAALAAARGGLADEALLRVAAGAGIQACYHAALARCAGAPREDPFAAKLRLYEAGSWPLGVVRGRAWLL